MQINTTSFTAISMTTSMTPTTATEETSFEDIMKSVDHAAGKHGRKPFPMHQQLVTIVEQAAAQGKITAAEHDEYLAILNDIHETLEELKDKRNPLCKHEECMQMKHMLAEDLVPPEDPLSAIFPAQADQVSASFLFQTEFVSIETDALAEFKSWVEKMLEEGNLPPKAKENLEAFVALRERFVAMITDLQEAFTTTEPATSISQSEADARFMSGIVQKPVPPTTNTDTEAEPEVAAVIL